MDNLSEEPAKAGAASDAAKRQWDSLREDLAEASATRLTGALRRISEEADDLAAALGAPREDKYEIWSALYGDDLTVFQCEPRDLGTTAPRTRDPLVGWGE